MQLIGEYIKDQRLKRKLTLRAVEEMTGIQNAYLSMVENGKIKKPSPDVLKKISDSFRISYNSLLEIAGYPVQETVTSSFTGVAEEFASLSTDEESKLLEYLKFLRSQQDSK
jgi:transcriptional regulator with XRE-family HTH domain